MLSLVLFEGCRSGHSAEEDPMAIVRLVARVAPLYGVGPTSLLVLHFDELLTRGSLKTDSSLLSLLLKTPKMKLPYIARHIVLSEALAVPLKIIVVMSATKSIELYSSDLTQNIRHKVLFFIVVMTKGYGRGLPKAALQAPAIQMLRNGAEVHLCVRNFDNLLLKTSKMTLKVCREKPLTCHLSRIDLPLTEQFAVTTPSTYTIDLSFRCNSTVIGALFIVMTIPEDSLENRVTSRWSLLEVKRTDCYSYILLTEADLRALIDVFQLETWAFLTVSALSLRVVWAAMNRSYSSTILGDLVLSAITVREIVFGPKRYSNTILGCVALAFTFLIGQLYANIMMSSFLNPTREFPATRKLFDCRLDPLCDNVKFLQRLLEHTPVCHFPKPLQAKMGKPLTRFHPGSNQSSHSGTIAPWPNPNFPFMLVSTQKSTLMDRLLVHGVISSTSLRIAEYRHRLDTRNSKEHLLTYMYEKHDGQRLEKTVRERSRNHHTLVTYDRQIGQFSMESFLAMLPLFGSCSLI